MAVDGGQSLDELLGELQQQAAASETGAAAGAHEGARGERGGEVVQPWSPELVKTLSGWFLLFGVAVCVAMAVLLLKKCRSTDVLRAFSLPLIIVSAVFLVVTGYSAQQISSVIGLLGAVAGYILGSRDSDGGKAPAAATATATGGSGSTDAGRPA